MEKYRRRGMGKDGIKADRQDGWLRRFWKERQFRRRMRSMDEQWYLTGGNCFGLFPPSFYYRHTEEEAEQIVLRELDKLRKIAAGLEDKVPEKQSQMT